MNKDDTTNTNKIHSNTWLIWTLILLLLLGLAAIFAAKENLVRFLNVDVNKDKTVVIGQRGADGKAGVNGLDGTSGSSGQNGSSGSSGAAGANGAQGVPGSNDCISGICVSRQGSTPGTQESGNINIDGAVIAAQAGIGTNSPSNTLSVAGTANFGGHTATGAGATVNGITSGSDAISGISSHNTVGAVYETLTTLDSASTMYEALGGVLKLDPSSAPTFSQIAGNNGGVEIAAGNAENFTGNITGMNGSIIHSGTGTVTTGVGLQGVLLNLSTGTISSGYGLRSIGINLNPGGSSGTITNYTGIDSAIAINMGTITNNKGIQIQTPTNAGTITNNYGLYIQDQSSVGTVINLNLASMGLTSNNWLQGFVGIGNITGPLDGQVHIVNDGSGNSFKVSDTGYADASPFVVDSSGKVGVRTASPGTNNSVFEVTGSAYVSDYVYTSMLRSATEINSKIDLYDSSNGIAFIAQNDTKDFRWGINSGSDLMTLDGATGRLGLGTTTPSAELDISQNATFITEMLLTQTTAGKTLTLGTTGNATSSWNIHNSYGELFFYNTGLSEASLELTDNGNVGIGTNFAVPSSKLTVKDSASAGSVLSLQNTAGTCTHTPTAGAETVSCSSDERLKTNIVDAASVLSEINGLKIHDYTVIANGLETTGLIAQEVLQTNPGMVHMGDDGYYKVDSYNPWKVLKGIQELSAGQTDLNTSFVTALAKTNGDLTATNELLSAQGIKLDTISTELKALADRVDVLETKNVSQDSEINELKTQLQQLKQQINTTP